MNNYYTKFQILLNFLEYKKPNLEFGDYFGGILDHVSEQMLLLSTLLMSSKTLKLTDWIDSKKGSSTLESGIINKISKAYDDFVCLLRCYYYNA